VRERQDAVEPTPLRHDHDDDQHAAATAIVSMKSRGTCAVA
jgi:hypothetical protein